VTTVLSGPGRVGLHTGPLSGSAELFPGQSRAPKPSRWQACRTIPVNMRKLPIALLGILSIVYFTLFIPTNLTGSKDENMLACFRIDEYAQYTVLRNMLAPTSSFLSHAWRFFAYEHYYYGFPFYLTSSIAVAPSRLCGRIARWISPSCGICLFSVNSARFS